MRKLRVYTVLGAGLEPNVRAEVPVPIFDPAALAAAEMLRMKWLPVLEHFKGDTCAFGEDYDPETLMPRGPRCGRRAVSVLVWRDARVSPSCELHGVEVLEGEAIAFLECQLELPLTVSDRVKWSAEALRIVEQRSTARGREIAAQERGTVTRTIDHPGLGAEVFVRWDSTGQDASTTSANLDRAFDVESSSSS